MKNNKILNKISDENCKDLLIALLDDDFIKLEDLESIVYFQPNGKLGEINMLDFFKNGRLT